MPKVKTPSSSLAWFPSTRVTRDPVSSASSLAPSLEGSSRASARAMACRARSSSRRVAVLLLLLLGQVSVQSGSSDGQCADGEGRCSAAAEEGSEGEAPFLTIIYITKRCRRSRCTPNALPTCNRALESHVIRCAFSLLNPRRPRARKRSVRVPTTHFPIR